MSLPGVLDPRPVITGVTKTAKSSDKAFYNWAFDWYSATIRDDSVGGQNGFLVVDELEKWFARCVIEEDSPLYGYGSCSRIRGAEGETLARVMWAGKQPWPLVLTSGVGCAATVRAVRALWPVSHQVSRADAAADVDSPGAFEELSRLAIDFADERGITVDFAGDWHRRVRGRTVYIGSRSSAVFLRIYEKGKQMRQNGLVDASLDWVRVELSVKPLKGCRQTAAFVDASELWGFSKWGTAFRKRLDGVEVEPLRMKEHRETDQQRAFRACMRQYGATLAREAHRLGSWDALGPFLRDSIDALSGGV